MSAQRGLGDADSRGRRSALLAAGGMLSAVAASSCCILPLALFSIGVSGAWIGTLTSLAPYQPWFLGLAAALLATGFYVVYRKTDASCEEHEACARPLPQRAVKAALWIGAVLVLAAAVFPWLAGRLLDS